MGTEAVHDFLGEWELEVGLPGAEQVRGRCVFEALGAVMVQRTSMPIPEAPDSVSIIVDSADG